MVSQLPDAQRIAVGNSMANWLVQHAEELGIQEITWNGWHWGYSNKWHWRPSTVKYPGNKPDHWNHVHVGLNRTAAAKPTLAPSAIQSSTAVRNTLPGTVGAPPQGTNTVAYLGGSGGVVVDPGSGAPITGPAAQPATPKTASEIDQFIKNEYGYLAGFMGHQEIGPILREAAAMGLSKDRLLGRLTGTDWWKTNSDAQRKWELLVNEDPATAARLREERRAEVTNQLARIGLQINAVEMNEVIEFSLRNDQTIDQIVDTLVTRFTPNDGTFDYGQLGQTQIELQQLEEEYQIFVPWTKMVEWAKRIVSGESDLDGIRPAMEEMARQKFGHNKTLMNSLDVGGNILDAISTQRDKISELLELDPRMMDMRDDRWKSVVDYADKDGTVRPMTDFEAGRFARRQGEWMGTDNGRKQTAMAGRSLAKVLGMAQ
jgi:hypothetical protein